MSITLKGIPTGDWRELTKPELEGILKMVEHSSTTNTRKEEDYSLKKVTKSKPKKGQPKQIVAKAPSNPDRRKSTKAKTGKTGKPSFGTSNRNSGKPQRNKGKRGR